MTDTTAIMAGQRLPATPGQRFFDKFLQAYAMFAITICEGAIHLVAALHVRWRAFADWRDRNHQHHFLGNH